MSVNDFHQLNRTQQHLKLDAVIGQEYVFSVSQVQCGCRMSYSQAT